MNMVNKQPRFFAGLHKSFNLGNGLVSILVCCVLGCGTSHKVYRADKVHAERGIYYALPRTVITVELPIIQTTYTAGRYAQFSEEMLGMKAESENNVSYKLGTPVLGTRTESDPNEVFLVKIAGNPLETRTLMLELSEDGRLASAQSDVENKMVDFVISTIKTTASIAAKAIMAGGVLKEFTEGKDEDVCKYLLLKLDPNRYRIVPKKVLNEIIADLKQTFGDEKIKKLENILNGKSLVFKEGNEEEKVFVSLGDYGQLESFINDAKDRDEKKAKALSDKLKEHKDIVLVYEGTDCNLDDNNSFDLVTAVGTKTAETIRNKIKSGDKDSGFGRVVGVTAKLGSKEITVTYLRSKGVSYMDEELKRPIAAKIALDIQATQKDRQSIIKGGGGQGIVEISEATMKLMLAEIDNQQSDRFENFLGKKKEAEWKARFEWIPDGLCEEEKINNEIDLLKFTKKDGIIVCKGAELSNIIPKDFLTKEFDRSLKLQKISLNFSADTSKQIANIIRKNSKIEDSNKPQGFYYRIPANAVVKLLHQQLDTDPRNSDIVTETQELSSLKVPVAQLGVVKSLPRNTGSWKKNSYIFDLYDQTGAMKKITVASDALEAEKVGDVGTAVTTIQDAIKEAKAAKEAEAAKNKPEEEGSVSSK